jgi:outer membrane protein OmpA-like peptidoglycan-associated protein
MPGEAKKKVRTRAIVFGDSPAPAEQPAAAAPPPAAAGSQQPVAAAQYQPAAPAGGQGTMQVGERAIAFPINFRVNSSEIMPESVPFIESIAGLLQKDPAVRLLIEGHTDSSGNATKNMSLSRERAFSVMNYLVDRYRVDPMRLVPVGKGFSEPLGGTEPTNPKNRRVQFRILG